MKTPMVALVVAFAACATLARAEDIPLHNWNVPGSGGIHALAEGPPVPFVSLTPCRIIDTRGGAPLGGGPLAASTPRNYTITGQCGITAGAVAASLNIAVTNTGGPGYVSIWPQGGTQPVVATLNYVGSQTIANAAVVPLSSGGGLSVACMNAGCDLIVDTNGYYTQTPAANNAGLYMTVNNGGYAGYFWNKSLTCPPSGCGIYVQADSNIAATEATTSLASSTTGWNMGVHGTAAGVGGTFNPSAPGTLLATYSSGVMGTAGNTSGFVDGVWGHATSAGLWAAGVVATETNTSANALLFQNSGGSTYGYLGSGGTGLYTNGNIATALDISGTTLHISGSPKNFVAPHPLDPTKEIVYAAIEGPSADVFFRGTAQLQNGSATIQIPEHFRLTAREDSYMTTLTAVGARSTLWVESEGPDGIVVRGAGSGTFHYVVYAERDETRDQQAVRDNVHFTPEALFGKAAMFPGLPPRTRALLVKNGTLNPDFSVNRATAQRLGWSVPTQAPQD